MRGERRQLVYVVELEREVRCEKILFNTLKLFWLGTILLFNPRQLGVIKGAHEFHRRGFGDDDGKKFFHVF